MNIQEQAGAKLGQAQLKLELELSYDTGCPRKKFLLGFDLYHKYRGVHNKTVSDWETNIVI